MNETKIFLLRQLIAMVALPLSLMHTCTAATPLTDLAENSVSAMNAVEGGVYGVPWASDSLHNLDVGGAEKQSLSFRFRAAKTDRLNSIRLFWTDNRDRPGYAKGNGGKIRIQVFADSGDAKHEPSGTALATQIFEPNWVDGVDPQGVAGIFRLLKFSAPPSLQEGQRYHLTFTNVASDPTANYVGLDLNIVYDGESQPVTPDVDFGVLVNKNNSGWRSASRNFAQKKPNTLTPIVSLDYADGSSQGSGYMEVWWQQPRQIAGSQAVRETFTPARAIRDLRSISLRVKRMSASGSLTIGLTTDVGTLVAQVVVPATFFRTDRHEWVTTEFGAPFNLLVGQRYDLTLTSQNGTYEAYCIRDGAAFGFGKGTVFADGFAEFNRGDERGWQGWYGWSSEGGPEQIFGDLQFYFSTQVKVIHFMAYVPLVLR